MTALTLKADLAGSCRDVSCVPLAAVSNRSKSSALLDHLVGEREQPVRNLEAEGLGSLRDVFPYVFGVAAIVWLPKVDPQVPFP
jgi:hypothetical protein